jgi:DNA-binding CsgD family transcriptional regulator
VSADTWLPPTLCLRATDLVSTSERALQTAGDGRGAATAVVLQGPGGTGKSLLLADLAVAHRQAGRAIANARTAPDPGSFSGPLAVLIDDAHRLTDDAARRVSGLLGHSSVRVAIACRPWPRPPALMKLLEDLGSQRQLIALGHLDHDGVASLARERLGSAATSSLVDVVRHQTGGLPALVHAVLGWLGQRTARPGPGSALSWLAPGQPARVALPDEVVDRIQADLAALEDDARMLLHSVALGAPLDPGLQGDLLGLPSGRAAELIEAARASGLLLGDGKVVPLVRGVLLSAAPADVTRHRRQQLLELLIERGDEPLQVARALAADHVRDPRAARLLERHGNAALRDDPVLAGELLTAAVASGASVTGLAARRAHVAALAGDLDTALQWADTVLPDESAADRSMAAGVSAAVLAQRGLLARSGALCRLAGPERAGSAALAFLATGFPDEAAAALEEADHIPAGSVPTMLSACEELIAQGVLQSMRSGPDAAADTAAALSTLIRAAALVEPMGGTALLLDTPAALAALVALHSGELGMADSLLTRALDANVGGPSSRPRHLLLLAWVAMLRGRQATARSRMAEAVSAAPGRLEPRDDLFLQALDVGLARRRSDVPALAAAWSRAREAVLRYPIDLFTLLPLGELVVAGARLKDSEHLRPHVIGAQALLARLGDPPLWATPLHWSAAQAAIVSDDPAELRPHAAALRAASRTSPYAAVLARSGRCWLRVLTGDVDAMAVVTAASELAGIGLSWDGSRLAGQAAARAVDPRDRTTLLTCARSLAEVDAGDNGAATGVTPEPGHAPGGSVGQLSEREREVARLVVDGRTYREIGARLFISAKTVEHHVSRMRQRLGASNRSDLLARLRAELD